MKLAVIGCLALTLTGAFTNSAAGQPARPPSAGPVQPNVPTPIRFRPGSSSTTVNGTVRGFSGRLYSLRVRGGQLANLRLGSANRFLFFNVTAPSGAMVFNGSGAANGAAFVGRLPQNGDYRIDVYLMRNEARRNGVAPYTLTVSLR